MADAFGILGQQRPAAAAHTTLYTVPGGKSTISSTLAVCNSGLTQAKFRVSVRPAGAALAGVHYLYFDAALGASVTVAITIGLTLAATDVVGVQSDTGEVNFHLYGNEVS